MIQSLSQERNRRRSEPPNQASKRTNINKSINANADEELLLVDVG